MENITDRTHASYTGYMNGYNELTVKRLKKGLNENQVLVDGDQEWDWAAAHTVPDGEEVFYYDREDGINRFNPKYEGKELVYVAHVNGDIELWREDTESQDEQDSGAWL